MYFVSGNFNFRNHILSKKDDIFLLLQLNKLQFNIERFYCSLDNLVSSRFERVSVISDRVFIYVTYLLHVH